MFIKIILVFLFIFSTTLLGRDVSVDVIVTEDMKIKEFDSTKNLEFAAMETLINQYFDEEKLNEEDFYLKYKNKFLLFEQRYKYLSQFFLNSNLVESAPVEINKIDVRNLYGKFTSDFQVDLFKKSYLELVEDLERTKIKTLFIISDFEIESNLTWFELGISKKENLKKAVVASWNNFLHQKLKNVEHVEFIEKDFSYRPDYFNQNSRTIKWKSLIKKVISKKENQTAVFEFINQFVVMNSRTSEVIHSFEFPTIKREYSVKSKKDLSSEIASLIFNSLSSEVATIDNLLDSNTNKGTKGFLELKLPRDLSISEILKLCNLLNERGVELNLKSTLKSYSTEGSFIVVHYDGDKEKLSSKLLNFEGKYVLDEKKILFLNLNDQSFAILLKESNN